MRVFVIRPFGTKEGIDFDRVDEVLIQPALRKLETRDDPISGGTTGLISRQGNIREDMVRRSQAVAGLQRQYDAGAAEIGGELRGTEGNSNEIIRQ